MGTHARADALAVAIGPVDTLNGVFINTMLFAFVPMLMLRHDDDRVALFARAGRIFATILAVTSVAIALFAPILASILGPGLAAREHDQTVTLLRLLAPSTFFTGAAAIYSALLYTERRFVIPGLNGVCINLATIVAALLMRKSGGVNSFAIGYTSGAAVQLLLAWRGSRDLRRAARADSKQTACEMPLHEILVKPGMFLLYASLIAVNIVVTRAFATHAGSGMAAAFDYCIRCFNVLVAYMVYPVAATLTPEIARLRGSNELARAYRLIDKGVALMAIAALTACIIGVALRTPVISLIYERGNFTPESTALVSGIFLGLAPGLFGWVLLDLIARCFFAIGRAKLPLAAAVVPVIVNLAVMSVLRSRGKLMDAPMLGLGASAGLIAAFLTLFTLIHVRRKSENLAPSLVEVR